MISDGFKAFWSLKVGEEGMKRRWTFRYFELIGLRAAGHLPRTRSPRPRGQVQVVGRLSALKSD